MVEFEQFSMCWTNDVYKAKSNVGDLARMVNHKDSFTRMIDQLGLVVVHNATSRSFLTSDNPVVWFDPSVPFSDQRPYSVSPSGPVVMLFPVSPTLLLLGTRDSATHFREHGLTAGDVPDENWVEHIAQISRFAYEAVIAAGRGQEDIVLEFANVSPVHDATTVAVAKDAWAFPQLLFGARKPKPKWRTD